MIDPKVKMRLKVVVCQQCYVNFNYWQKKSPNYPRFCKTCRHSRTASNKESFEKNRRGLKKIEVPKLRISDVSDRGMNPWVLIDLVARSA